jgi:methionyl-tRNA synthetase
MKSEAKMPEHILIAIAWPYANAEIHVGNITGSHLPGDIVARYHRLKGDTVLMVSGTDSHGTPVTIAADKEGRPVEEVYKRYHDGFIELFRGLGISYDLFTTTHTENHFKVSQSMFLALKQNGFLFTQKSMQWYSPSSKRFLPDRYVEGTCYICGFEGARSDQCDNCARRRAVPSNCARPNISTSTSPNSNRMSRSSSGIAPITCAIPSSASLCARSSQRD